MSRIIQKINYKLKCLATDGFCKIGFRSQILKERPGSRILVYHGIDEFGQTHLNARFLSAELFEQQIKYFKQHFSVLPLKEIFEGNIVPGRMNIAITFDDGYLNNLTHALPILEKYEVPATFFVTGIRDTDYPMLWADYLDIASHLSSAPIEIKGLAFHKRGREYYAASGQSLKSICKQRTWAFKKLLYTAFPEVKSIQDFEQYKIYWEHLTIEEIQQLAASPFAEIGVHGYLHDNLGVCTLEEASGYLSKAKIFLENVIGKNISMLGYPDSSYSRPLVRAAEAMGFDQQYAADYLFPEDFSDPVIFNRFVINPFISLDNQIRTILSGKY